jgi:DNA-binding IclR family transcriptional regulator
VSNVPAARNVLRVLRLLATRTDPTPAATIARELDLPRSSVYHLLRALLDEGFVVHFPEDRGYALSSLLGDLGVSGDRGTRLHRLGRPVLLRLVAESGLPVVAQLGTLHGSDVVYVAQESARRAPSLVSAIGVRLPAHLTATGRAMLAALDHAQVRALFPDRESLIVRSGGGPGTLRELDELLLGVRERGWAEEHEEISPAYASVAAVVLDRNELPAAAVALTYRVSVADAGSLAPSVRAAAGALSARLQGRV